MADAGRIPFVAGFESTFLPLHDVDGFETTGHHLRWREDVDEVAAAGVETLRYPLRWHRIEASPGAYDWTETDRVLDHLRGRGLRLIVDLVHHTSHPRWLDGGFADPRFGPAFERYCVAVAERYPWVEAYTLFNEPFATLFLSGHEGLWPPYDRGVDGFARLLRSVLPALCEAATAWRQLVPHAQHVWVDTCEWHAGTPGAPSAYAELANDRRFVVADLVRGTAAPDRPFVSRLLAAGGEPLLDLPLVQLDVLGLDYYPHSEWFYDEEGAHAPSHQPLGFAAVAQQYATHFGLPMMLTETNIRGLPADRVTWLRHMLLQYVRAVQAGVPLGGFCWFPHVASCDWDSLLARPGRRPDPVGVVDSAADGSRTDTEMTRAWRSVALGADPRELPAYRLQEPADRWLRPFLAGTSGWPWQDPTGPLCVPPVLVPNERIVVDRPRSRPDLVVLSHLRWTWVWQRPQHLVSRLASERSGSGARTWFVEEPVAMDIARPTLRSQAHGDVTRVWLEVPAASTDTDWPGFGAPGTESYADLLVDLLRTDKASPDVWLYTPMALEIAGALSPDVLVYDVMDDLASFAGAPVGLRLAQRRTLQAADLVIAGGRSLHRGVVALRPDAHLAPSGVETAHYAPSRLLRRAHPRPVAGYVGVLDERLDVALIAELAAALPDWDIELVGPIPAKIDPAVLPRADNIHYLGQRSYDELPAAMARFDVAIMPFALNEATRSISPTKTLEFLAAGLPVVSTRVPDVVHDFSTVVRLADDGAAFAVACTEVVRDVDADRDRRVRPIRDRHEWDTITEEIADLVEAARSADDRTAAAGASA